MFRVHLPVETKTLGDFFMSILALVNKVTRYMLSMGEVIDIHRIS